MGKLVSPEEMHEFLMSLPSDVLEKESQKVKRYLNTEYMEAQIEEETVNE